MTDIDKLIAEALRRLNYRRPDIQSAIGDARISYCKKDIQFVVEALESLQKDRLEVLKLLICRKNHET